MTDIGRALSCVVENAYRNSFQLNAIQRIQLTTMPGATRGTAILRNMPSRDAPSTRAASSSSIGTSRNIWVRMMIGNGRLNVAFSNTNPNTLSYSPTWNMKRTNGVTKTTGGMIRCDRNQVVRL